MSRKWKYRLKSGAYLRDIIDDGSNEDTLKALKNCYKEIHLKSLGLAALIFADIS